MSPPTSNPKTHHHHRHHPSAASATFPTKRKLGSHLPSGDALAGQRPRKKPRTGASSRPLQGPDAVKHALLAQYYPTTLTLRQYLLQSLPASSRLRRRKIAAAGPEPSADQAPDSAGIRAQLATLLDTAVVGLHVPPIELAKAQSESRLQQWIDYSQSQGDDSRVTLSGGGDASAVHFQSEIVDFIVWLLFAREKGAHKRPSHLLCDGFRKGTAQQAAMSSTQGLYSLYFNERVASVKQAPWPQLLHLLGKAGESIMINLLLDCSIFLPVQAGQGNYYQLSGTPIFECEPLAVPCAAAFERKPTEIVFVRSRMLYARAALNARGLVHFGLRHIHALNRFPVRKAQEGPDSSDVGRKSNASFDSENSLRIMMYMFPRQFGLHNAFTSHVDHAKTAQKFQDYTLREEEILSRFRKAGPENSQRLDARVPKRLRGEPEHLVQRMQILHARCSYAQLLEHHCPVRALQPRREVFHAPPPKYGPKRTQWDGLAPKQPHTSSPKAAGMGDKPSGKAPKSRRKARHSTPSAAAATQVQVQAQAQAQAQATGKTCLTGLSVPVSSISAFCQAVLSKIIPHQFWGLGSVQEHNRARFLRNVHHFLKLRRFETVSLHEVMQGLKMTDIKWLEPPGLKGQRCSHTDLRKRREIFSEFVYYVFDSLLIPLIRSNFYVTESNVHRNRVFYFRHDVWRSVAEPAMVELKGKMFEEVKLDDALRILDSRRLGYSQVRLLPKQTSVRPIMNLRRRMIASKDTKMLGYSINSILGPVYNMVKLEKSCHPARLGSAMFSVGDLYERLASFKQRLGPNHRPLYFAKVDVQAAFDTIPQDAIVALMNSVPAKSGYDMIKHVEVAPNKSVTGAHSKTWKRWHTFAKAPDDTTTFLEQLAKQTALGKKNTVFVDSVFRKRHPTRDLLALLASHIQQNLVKIGKKYYRQKAGIPQGSVLSSVLCNYFYADLEQRQLSFLRSDDCLLLRLIDDFLLITTDQSKAARFVTAMQEGMPKYGVTVAPAKTLVNFPLVAADDVPVPALPPGTRAFPYCGTQISTRTLALARDRGRDRATAASAAVADALTVAFARRPGAAFVRAARAALARQARPMFLDAAHNTAAGARCSLRDALVETAARAWAYARCLPAARRPRAALWARAIGAVADAAAAAVRRAAWRAARGGIAEDRQVRRLVLGAFRDVLGRKQARLGEVLAWLDREMGRLEGTVGKGVGGRDVKMLR